MLPRAQRLRRRSEFSAVYGRRQSVSNDLLVLYLRRFAVEADGAPRQRFGFVVSRKVGKAHDRNRVKRRLRESCRQRSPRLVSAFDAIVVARSAAAQASWGDLDVALAQLLMKSRLTEGEAQS